ncbi:hypothetical protein T4D_16420 [Trichinella pseudospiralis]|uniref:Uncharacterized protein n=1 Tax=Trichinella pseudospiralis TaxID=6337 RepID=A0A0V1FLL2_TRIPS|nr:hypothetical protein T4D_16420 [Trichinella pseudospiralis]
MSSVCTLCCPLQLVTFISTQRTTIDMEMTTISVKLLIFRPDSLIATSFRPYQIPLPQTLTIHLCCSELPVMKRRSAVCSTATENQMMTLFIDELLSCTYDSSRCSRCKALLVTSINALEQ